MSVVDPPGPEPRAALAGAFLSLEEERQEREQLDLGPSEDIIPGTGAEEEKLTVRDALQIGGTFPFVLLATLNAFDEFESAALSTLAPNIRDSLGISDGLMVAIGSASSAFLILGSVPMGWLADNVKRSPVIAISSLIFSVCAFISGLAVNAFMLVMARLGVGIAKSNTLAVHGSYIADRYPIATRGRLSAMSNMLGRTIGTVSPLLVGAIAAAAGGDEGWRWSFLILSTPVAVLAFFAFFLPEPPRGQFEQKGVIGHVNEDADPAPIAFEAAFRRIRQIKTMNAAIAAFSVIGFGLFTLPVVTNIFLEEHYDLGTFGRGAVGTTAGIAILVALPFIGRFYDATYQKDPQRAARLIAWVLLPNAVIVPIQFFMPNPYLFAALSIFPAVLSTAAFAMTGPLLMIVIPYRLRGLGSAIGSIYLFFIGATGGAILSGLFVNAYGPRTTILLVYVPATLIGALLFLRGASSIKGDIAANVAEIREEEAELRRQQDDPENIPALQVSHVDFSYGQVQILFDVSFEVRKGEVLALLGTNGAGKSTALRVVAGLGTPSRGVVRHHGRGITYCSPEVRTRLGIRMLPGGKGVFPDLTIRDNMLMATYNQRKDRAEVERRIAKAIEYFPELRDRMNEPASALSGGQQQLLALARILTDEPDVLIIDELSLGLAPIMVERLVAVIDQLRADGMTIVIVEQSLNVAAAVADRAVFLEKGHVKFEGELRTLMERDDLARAVFLGAEGG